MIYNNKEINESSQRIIKVFLIIVVMLGGLWVVSHLSAATGRIFSGAQDIMAEVQKIRAVLTLIQQNYVEDPDLDILGEGAIEGMLKRLDPHSVYFSSSEQEEISEIDRGEFEGIGISFIIQNELINVIAPITGTPAERLGIRSGDKIVEIDSVSAYGITNDEVFKKLRGPKGSTVMVKIVREGVAEALDFTIVRDKIPIYSIWTKFMLDDSTSYILINQFTATTTKELSEVLTEFESQGMTRLVLDLRNNQGGRLNQAVAVTDMFIPGDQVIVSKLGRIAERDSVYCSTQSATHPMFDLIILINGGSASASEIVAGAVQDLDRGLIIGQNSFGKGLVQSPFYFPDGGAIRISTAHWYTPSGRLVQRPYDKGRGEYYAIKYRDPDEITDQGEKEAFKTIGGRTVYASSGIAPDVLVEERKITGASIRVISERWLFDFARDLVQKYGFTEDDDFLGFRRGFEVSEEDFAAMKEFINRQEEDFPTEILDKDQEYLKEQLKAEIAQLAWNNKDYYYIIRTESDPAVVKAVEHFEQAHNVTSSVWHRGDKG